MQIYTLDGSNMTDREASHNYLAESLSLPAYYGKNLDALADCLSELPGDTVIVLEHASLLPEQMGSYGEAMLETFRELSEPSHSFCYFEKA